MEANDKDIQKLNNQTNQLFKMKWQLSFFSKLKKGGSKDGRKSFKCGNPTCLFNNLICPKLKSKLVAPMAKVVELYPIQAVVVAKAMGVENPQPKESLLPEPSMADKCIFVLGPFAFANLVFFCHLNISLFGLILQWMIISWNRSLLIRSTRMLEHKQKQELQQGKQ